MAPTGVHGLIGLGLAWKVKHPGAKVGVAWGSLLPDMDLLAAPLVLLLTQDEKATASVHRTWTHSLLVIGAIALLALALRARKHRGAPFAGGVALGMGVHVFADLFYIAGVPLLYPLSRQEYWVVPPLYSSAIDFNAYNPTFELITALDFMGEAVFYLAVFHLLRGEKTPWRRVLPLAAGANLAIYTGFAWLSTQGLPLNTFMVGAYIPGLAFLALSTTLPLWVRGRIGRMGGPKATAPA
ncbi:MAG: metal-dependent hydrolase [Euryarchaeota archaeon]|nr:metal-dependent hydrolase [Euryarchaeota archaeon]